MAFAQASGLDTQPDIPYTHVDIAGSGVEGGVAVRQPPQRLPCWREVFV